MKLSENVFMLKVEDGEHTVYPALIRNTSFGSLALVDALWPGQFPIFEKAIAEEGFAVKDIETILLTHHDCDHVACVGDFRERNSDINVLCYSAEAPYVDGRKRPCKVVALEAVFDTMTESEKEAFYPYREKYLKSRTRVAGVFEEGIVFPNLADGLRVIHSPGHTPGHVCFLAEGTLIAGDALNAQNGKLLGPKKDKCENYEEALLSLKKLTELSFERILCYHGGLVTDKVKEALDSLIPA